MSEKHPASSQIKLIVDSASEAVAVLRERYGEKARVLSVRQVEAEGLKRLISKPRLEVIVEVPAEAPAPAPKVKAKAKPKKKSKASKGEAACGEGTCG